MPQEVFARRRPHGSIEINTTHNIRRLIDVHSHRATRRQHIPLAIYVRRHGRSEFEVERSDRLSQHSLAASRRTPREINVSACVYVYAGAHAVNIIAMSEVYKFPAAPRGGAGETRPYTHTLFAPLLLLQCQPERCPTDSSIFEYRQSPRVKLHADARARPLRMFKYDARARYAQ